MADGWWVRSDDEGPVDDGESVAAMTPLSQDELHLLMMLLRGGQTASGVLAETLLSRLEVARPTWRTGGGGRPADRPTD